MVVGAPEVEDEARGRTGTVLMRRITDVNKNSLPVSGSWDVNLGAVAPELVGGNGVSHSLPLIFTFREVRK